VIFFLEIMSHESRWFDAVAQYLPNIIVDDKLLATTHSRLSTRQRHNVVHQTEAVGKPRANQSIEAERAMAQKRIMGKQSLVYYPMNPGLSPSITEGALCFKAVNHLAGPKHMIFEAFNGLPTAARTEFAGYNDVALMLREGVANPTTQQRTAIALAGERTVHAGQHHCTQWQDAYIERPNMSVLPGDKECRPAVVDPNDPTKFKATVKPSPLEPGGFQFGDFIRKLGSGEATVKVGLEKICFDFELLANLELAFALEPDFATAKIRLAESGRLFRHLKIGDFEKSTDHLKEAAKKTNDRFEKTALNGTAGDLLGVTRWFSIMRTRLLNAHAQLLRSDRAGIFLESGSLGKVDVLLMQTV
jgi:hypothetical protein